MPALRSPGGRFLVSYDAFKHHYSLFPASGAVVEALGDELAPYLAGKGTIRFPADRPIPLALVTRIVRVRLEENAARPSVEARSGRGRRESRWPVAQRRVSMPGDGAVLDASASSSS